MSQTFSMVNDEVLESLILGARQKIVYVAPGVSTRVAKSLGDRFLDLGPLEITLILDVDPEVYRLGYGDPEGLDVIKQLADDNFLELRQQAGIRIGLLIADDKTLIYSPTPRLIEAGSTQSAKPNAIVLDSTPAVIDRACASGSESLPLDAEIGRDFVKPEELESVKKDLGELPPKRFDIARLERVFNSRIQYVELKLKNYKLSKKIAPIPPDLMGLADDPEIQNRWKNAFLMFDGADKITVEIPHRDEDGNQNTDGDNNPIMRVYGEKELEAERRKIEKDFFYKVAGYGVVIFRSRRSAFDERLRRFKVTVEDYKSAVDQEIEESIEDAISRLAIILLPLIRERIPDRYLKSEIDEPDVRDHPDKNTERGSERENFGTVDENFSPEIKVQFKDIAYETISENTFYKALRRAGIAKRKLTELFSEHNAAPEASGENRSD